MQTGYLAAISGPSSTGKSSLVDELRERAVLPDVIFIEEMARKVFFQNYSAAYRDLDHLLSEKAYEYQLELANRTVGNKTPGKITICDRAPFDILVYALMNMGQIGLGITEIMRVILETSKDVDCVFMTRDNGSYVDDGFRARKYRDNRTLEISLFNHFASVLGNKVIWLPDGIDKRIDIVLSHLEEVGAYNNTLDLNLA